MAQNPFEKALVDEGLVGTPLESLARSIYTQESSGGKNTKTSNAGAERVLRYKPNGATGSPVVASLGESTAQ
jgi:hypothetical protein